MQPRNPNPAHACLSGQLFLSFTRVGHVICVYILSAGCAENTAAAAAAREKRCVFVHALDLSCSAECGEEEGEENCCRSRVVFIISSNIIAARGLGAGLVG